MEQSSWQKLFPDSISGFYHMLLLAVCATLFLAIKLNAMAIGFLGLSWIATQPWKRLTALKGNSIALLFIALYALYGFGLLYSANMDIGRSEMSQKLSLFIFPVILTTGPRIGKEVYRAILRVFYLGTIILCLIALAIAVYGYLTGVTENSLMSYLTYRELSTPVGFDPIYMALYIVAAIFLIIDDRLLDTDIKLKKEGPLLTWIMLSFLFLNLIFLSSRMEILVFLACLALLLLWKGYRSGKWLKPIILLISVPVLSLILISVNDVNKERFTEMVDMESDYTENKWGGRSIRIEKWKNAIECWGTAPIIGVGTGDFMDELMKVYEKNDFQLAIDNYFNPHNQYLQTAITHGAIGLLLLLVILGNLIYTGLKRRSWILVIFALIFALSVITESMFQRQKGIVFFVFLAMVLAQYRSVKEAQISEE